MKNIFKAGFLALNILFFISACHSNRNSQQNYDSLKTDSDTMNTPKVDTTLDNSMESRHGGDTSARERAKPDTTRR